MVVIDAIAFDGIAQVRHVGVRGQLVIGHDGGSQIVDILSGIAHELHGQNADALLADGGEVNGGAGLPDIGAVQHVVDILVGNIHGNHGDIGTASLAQSHISATAIGVVAAPDGVHFAGLILGQGSGHNVGHGGFAVLGVRGSQNLDGLDDTLLLVLQVSLLAAVKGRDAGAAPNLQNLHRLAGIHLLGVQAQDVVQQHGGHALVVLEHLGRAGDGGLVAGGVHKLGVEADNLDALAHQIGHQVKGSLLVAVGQEHGIVALVGTGGNGILETDVVGVGEVDIALRAQSGSGFLGGVGSHLENVSGNNIEDVGNSLALQGELLRRGGSGSLRSRRGGILCGGFLGFLGLGAGTQAYSESKHQNEGEQLLHVFSSYLIWLSKSLSLSTSLVYSQIWDFASIFWYYVVFCWIVQFCALEFSIYYQTIPDKSSVLPAIFQLTL